MFYRLGINVNYGGISLSVIELVEGVPAKFKRLITRHFPVGREDKSKVSLNAKRREVRQGHHNLDRRKIRKNKIFNLCQEHGLVPDKDFFGLDPYESRNEVAYGRGTKFDLARALFDIARKRGYATSRSEGDEEADDKKDTKTVLKAIKLTEAALVASGCPTLGAYIYSLLGRKNEWGQKVPVKSNRKAFEKKVDEDIFGKRWMYEKEFEVIKEKSAFGLPEEFWAKAHEIIFFQLPLKSPVPGFCTLYYKYQTYRAARALPCFQRFRILQDLANLKIQDGWEKIEIDEEVKREILNLLLQKKQVTFTTLCKKLKLEPHQTFNLQSDRNKFLEGDPVGATLCKPEYFGKKWLDFSLFQQDEVVKKLISEGDPQKLIEIAMAKWDLPKEKAENLARLSIDSFPSGNAHYSQKALTDLIRFMEPVFAHPETIKKRLVEEVEVELTKKLDYYAKVMPQTGMNFTDNDAAAIDEINFGKIGNPTVHIILNQLRKMINGVIDVYGAPEQIIVELKRDLKQTKKVRDAITKQNKDNETKNKKAVKFLLEKGIDPTEWQVEKYKLWQELNYKKEDERFCVFTGKQITFDDLVNDRVKKIHIWPYARTYDNSNGNLILGFGEVLESKGDFTPDEAYNNPDSVYDYAGIKERVKTLPRHKQYKFKPGSFGPHQLNIRSHTAEKAYATKVIQEYMKTICRKVWTSAGSLTPILREQWDLNDLLPDYDLRQGGLDAAVTGLVEKALMKKANWKSSHDQKIEFETPWPGLKENLKQVLENSFVAHRPDHRCLNGIYEGSNYAACDPETNEIDGRKFNLKMRTAISGLTDAAITKLVDPEIRKHLLETKDVWKGKEKGLQTTIREFKKSNVKALKVYKCKNPTTTLYHHDKRNGLTHHRTVLSAANHHSNIWRLPKGVALREGTKKENWKVVKKDGTFYVFENITLAAAALEKNRKVKPDKNLTKPHPAAKLMMQVYKSDMVYYKRDDKVTIGRVAGLGPSNGKFELIPHKDGRGSNDRVKITVSYKQLLDNDFRKVKFSEISEFNLGRNVFEEKEEYCFDEARPNPYVKKEGGNEERPGL